MSNSSFFIVIICAALFAVYFLLYGYFAYRKKEENSKRVSKVFLVQGIILALVYAGIVTLSMVAPNILGLQSSDKAKTANETSSENTNGVTGLTGSIGNGARSIEYPSDPIIAGMLSRGDAFLKDNNIEAAIKEFKQGLNNEEYKSIFEKRMEHALNMKDDFKIYQTGLNYFNKGDYESAYNEFKDIKPNELKYFADVMTKMEIISSGSLPNTTNNQGGTVTGTTGQNTPVVLNTQGNTQTPVRP